MAHLLRGKQAGISRDLSAGLSADLFGIDDIARFGISSQISCLAYDPVQSLLAAGTKSSQFGASQIYIFGGGRVEAVLPTPARSAHLRSLQFCAEKLVALDTRNDVSVYSLEMKRLVASYSPPGQVNVVCSDPMLDYVLLGMHNGDVLAYDMDREALAPFRIPNLWTEFDAMAKVTSIVSLQLHPRDVGTLLIGYAHGAVIYSFKLNKVLRYYRYEIPRGAPGGDGNPATAQTIRLPRLTQAAWHPTGTFVMTGHEDSSIVFWDTLKDGRMLMARTVSDTNVASPATAAASRSAMGDPAGTYAVKEPLWRVAWCANHPDPEDTALLVAGGQSTRSPTRGLTLFDFGRTPIYATSPWETLSAFFESPKRQRMLPTPPGAEVIDFCLIPRATPHFAGAHDPIAVIALLTSGELLTLSFPSGMPISPTNQLHVSLNFVHPFIKTVSMVQVGRDRWLGLQERRQSGPPILQGGSEIPLHGRRHEDRSIAVTSHADGTVRLWDPGYGDEMENPRMLQVDVARAVGRYDDVSVTQTSFAGASAELAVGLRSGELLIFRWSTNRNAGVELKPSRQNQPGALTPITDRAEPSLSEGLCPLTLLDARGGPVTAVCMSEIGFAAVGSEGGGLMLVDLRGPAIILKTSVQDFARDQRSGFLRRSKDDASKSDWVTCLEFSIMMLEGDDYSSILLHAGTNLGHLATFKIVPEPSGRYTAQLAGSIPLDSTRIIYIAALNPDAFPARAIASQTALGNLSSGVRIAGAVLAVTPTGAHIFRPASSKGAHRSFDNYFCDAAAIITDTTSASTALMALFGDGKARIYALPSLREISSQSLTALPANPSAPPQPLDVRRFSAAAISSSAHILAFTGPSALALLSLTGTGQPLPSLRSTLFAPARLIPPRPTISAVAWVTGTQYITPLDLDVLIGGPDRPPSKRMIAQARAEEELRRQQTLKGASASAATAAAADEGYWAYMQRQIQERTEKLGLASDSMGDLEESSSQWLKDVNDFVGRQKRNVATGLIRAKFGI